MADRQEHSGRPIGDTEGAGESARVDGRNLWQSRALRAAEGRAEAAEHESAEEREDRERRELQKVAREPKTTRWHSSRAQGKRELFERVERCGSETGARITLVCRGCKEKSSIEVGCNSHWFCPACRQRTAQKFRLDFERKRLGLVAAATRAGLTRRNQRRGERWGERLLTLTLPHLGNARERVRTLRATWARFWRTLRKHLAPKLRGDSGITLEDVARGFPKNFEKRDDPNSLKLLDLLSYLHVFEWTPGTDGEGHPHMHVWLFSQYIDRDLIKELWEAAYAHVLDVPRVLLPSLVVDIRKAGGDVAHELVKYLTKDWEISSTGAKRASPATFANVYAELDGKRMRQSSAGLAMWAVAKVNACPCCGFERERGHWARVDIEHELEHVKEPIGRELEPEPTTAPLVGASRYEELRNEFEQKRDADWSASFELRILRTRVRAALQLPEKKSRGTRHEQLTLGENHHGKRERTDDTDLGRT